jgi:hypothetical protein
MRIGKTDNQPELFMTTTVEEPAATETDDTSGEAATNGANGKGNRRPRGKGIIYFGLREADEALRKIDPQAKRMSRPGFAVALGHKKAENRFAQKLDALKTFKLLEEDGDDVKLTDLATDMLYAGSESARNQARAKAFLSYPDFQRTFIECPKNQDHPLSYVREFVTGKLGIVNEADRFLRLFLESAHFSGLLEGEPDTKAERIKLRPGGVTDSKAVGDKARPAMKATEQALPAEEANKLLDQCGLTDLAGRAEVFRASAGRVKTITEGGKLTIEIDSPIRLVLQSDNVLDDLVRVLRELKERGFQT